MAISPDQIVDPNPNPIDNDTNPIEVTDYIRDA